uniref:Uncharacterized protein n=1 Tax=Meloidogyne enterolobii TaxID=390850 RepID=A0A6V7TMZ8_MELEN|nr:unnamed protein product [Meloidogyne enterolobii]
MRICHEMKRSKMVFLHRFEHFRIRFLMHIFAYFGTFVHICRRICTYFGKFSIFLLKSVHFWHFLLEILGYLEILGTI